jgi:hypothetical protein
VDFDGENFIFNIEHVSFVPAEPAVAKKVVKKKFRCIQSKHEFETEVVPNSQVICPTDGSEKVEEIKEQPKEPPKQDVEKKPELGAMSSEKKPGGPVATDEKPANGNASSPSVPTPVVQVPKAHMPPVEEPKNPSSTQPQTS